MNSFTQTGSTRGCRARTRNPGGKAPVEAGLVALAPLGHAYGKVGEREAVARTVMDKRWQMGLDGLGAEQPPCSQRTLLNFRMRLIPHHAAKVLLERTVALAEQTGGRGTRQRHAALASPPLWGAGRVEDTLHLRGHALRKAVGVAAQALETSAEALVEDAGLVGGTAGSQQHWTWMGGTHGTGAGAALWPGGRGAVETLVGAAAPLGACASPAGRAGHYRTDWPAGHRT
jgi:hypothetical protein